MEKNTKAHQSGERSSEMSKPEQRNALDENVKQGEIRLKKLVEINGYPKHIDLYISLATILEMAKGLHNNTKNMDTPTMNEYIEIMFKTLEDFMENELQEIKEKFVRRKTIENNYDEYHVHSEEKSLIQ